MRRPRIVSTLVALVVLLGCGADPVRVQVRAFEHPEDVAFVCLDVANGEALPLGACADSGDDAVVSLHAVVTQGGRGQVAVVDLDEDEVLDAESQVPGFTFVPVGEIPSDILIPEDHPELTFVADLGSFDIVALETRRLRFPARDGEDGHPFVRIPLPAAPSDLAISADETKLYATLPSLGAVAVIERASVTIGEDPPTPVLIDLAVSVPDPIAPVAAAPDDTDYCRVCAADDGAPENPVDCAGLLLDPWPTDDTGAPVPATPREPSSTSMSPRPVAAVVDGDAGDAGRLLVADVGLPLIHVIDIATGMPGEPIVTSVPVEDLALTPRVPTTIDGAVDPEDPTTWERYIYAIDATDRSVMAIRYDEETPSQSAVLPVSVRGGAPADRIRLPSGARVLEVITPEYPDGTGDPEPVRCTKGSDLEEDAGPTTLRGVFLVAGLLNGNLHVVDVYDLDAECRGGAPGMVERDGENVMVDGCEVPSDPDDATVYIRRHRPRIGTPVVAGMTLVRAPTVETERLTVTVDVDGSTGDETVPGLVPLREPVGEDEEEEPATCGPLEAQVFPFESSEEALICALADPWAAEVEAWEATWEGPISGTSGGRGRFGDPSARELFVEVPVCGRGVLGRENLDALDPALYEASYAPDLLALTGTLPPSTEDREACQALLDEDDPDGGLIRLELPIERAEQRDVDGDLQHVLTLADRTRSGVSFSELANCFPELVTYEIRSQNAYTVLGGRTGLQHRVVVDEATGLCTVDETQPSTRIGKALPGRDFDNGIVRFRIGVAEPPLGPQSEAQMGFQIAQTPRELSIGIDDDLSTIVSDIAYSEMDERLYAVDTQFRGLVRIQVAPVRVLQSFE